MTEEVFTVGGRRFRCVYPPSTRREEVEEALSNASSDPVVSGSTVIGAAHPFVCYEEWVCGGAVAGVAAPLTTTYARATIMLRRCPKGYARLWNGFVEAAKCGRYIALFFWPIGMYAVLDTRSGDWSCLPRALPKSLELARAAAEAVGRLDRAAADRLLALLSV